MWCLKLVFSIVFLCGILGDVSHASTVHSYALDNGVRVVLIPDSKASLNSVRVLVNTGSINEAPLLGSGLSHYLEHLVAGGETTLHPESYYESSVARMGGASNAYTTHDHTAYFINTVPQHTKAALKVLYEWMFYAKWTPAQFQREQQVILKEMERSDANLQRLFYFNAQRQFYEGHPLGVPVIGYRSDFFEFNERAGL